MYMIRGDWNHSEKHRVFGSFYWANYSLDSPLLASGGTIPGYMSESIVTNTREMVVNDIYTFSPRVAQPVYVLVSEFWIEPASGKDR